MRAVELRGAGELAIVERPDPVPGPGEVLIAPHAVGICATDVEILDGVMAYYRTGQAAYPVVPGHEWSGEVVGFGTGVAGLAVGDHVVGEVSLGCGTCEHCRSGRYHVCADARETGIMGRDGAMATLMTHPARATFTVPAAVPHDAAALVEPASVALYAVRRARCAGRRVLVLGTGTIGLLALQLARAEGAIAVAAANPSPARLEAAAALGASPTVVLPRDVAGAIEALRAAGPIDVVIECAGAPAAVAAAIEAVEPAGTVVLVGLVGSASVPLDVDRIVTKDLDVQGVNGSPSLWPDTIAAVASGSVRTEPLVSHHLPLDRAGEGFALVRARAPGTRKVLVHPQAAHAVRSRA